MSKSIKKITIIAITLIAILLISTFSLSYANKVKAKEIVDLGNKYLSESRYEEAIIEFEKAITIDKKNVDAYIGAAKGYVYVENIDKAEEILNIAIDTIPKKPNIYLELADIYLEGDKIEEAIEILGKGYEESKDDEIKNKLDKIVDDLEIVLDKKALLVGTGSKIRLIKKLEDETIIPINVEWKVSDNNIATFIDDKSEIEQLLNNNSINNTNEEEPNNIKEEDDKFGVIKGNNIGKVTVIAQIGTIEKSIEVEVEERLIERISLRRTGADGRGYLDIARRKYENSSEKLFSEGGEYNNGMNKVGFNDILEYKGNEYYTNKIYDSKVSSRFITDNIKEREFEYELYILDKNSEPIECEVNLKTDGNITITSFNDNLFKGSYKEPHDFKLIFTIGDFTSALTFQHVVTDDYTNNMGWSFGNFEDIN